MAVTMCRVIFAVTYWLHFPTRFSVHIIILSDICNVMKSGHAARLTMLRRGV